MWQRDHMIEAVSRNSWSYQSVTLLVLMTKYWCALFKPKTKTKTNKKTNLPSSFPSYANSRITWPNFPLSLYVSKYLIFVLPGCNFVEVFYQYVRNKQQGLVLSTKSLWRFISLKGTLWVQHPFIPSGTYRNSEPVNMGSCAWQFSGDPVKKDTL